MVAKHFIVNSTAFYLGVLGIIALVVLVFGLIFFGRLVKHQLRIWLLAKRGYTQIRHVKEDMTEKYYFLRITNDHFDFDKGIRLDQPDTKTKSKTILAPLNYDLLSKKDVKNLSAEEVEILGFLRSIQDSKVMDISTLSWGIPTITYFGNNPNPVNYKDIKKVYDAKNIAAMIKRIIMTKEWKFVQMVLIICVVAIGLWVVLGFLDYGVANKSATNLQMCQGMLNATTEKYTQLLNSTRVFNVVANSTVTI